jgi:hypothetical protein
MDIEENPRSRMNRSIFITFYDHDAVRMALTVSSSLFFIFYQLIYLYLYFRLNLSFLTEKT